MMSEGNDMHLFAVDTTNGTIYNTGYLMYQQQEVRYHSLKLEIRSNKDVSGLKTRLLFFKKVCSRR